MTLLAMSLLSVALLVVAAELGSRWWIRSGRAYYVFPPGLRRRLHLDRKVFPELEPVVRFEINSEGERGSEVPRVAAGEKLYRILVAGGSQPEGFFLDQDTCWPGALQRLLARPENLRTLGASKVHVGSVARSGVGAESLELILNRILPRYPRLQAIMLLVGGSEVNQWLERGGASTSSPGVQASSLFQCHPEMAFGSMPADLASTELLRRFRQQWLRPVTVDDRGALWIPRARKMRARAKVVRTTIPDPTEMLDHFESCFRKAVLRAQAHADRVVAVRQSWFEKGVYTADEIAHLWHGGVGRAWREDVSTFYSLDIPCRLMAMLDARVARVAEDLDVEQIELQSLLEPSLDLYYDWLHLTPAGAKAVATAVAATILGSESAFNFEAALRRSADLRAS